MKEETPPWRLLLRAPAPSQPDVNEIIRNDLSSTSIHS